MRGLCKIIGFYMIMLVITIMSLVCISDGVCQAKVKSDKCKTKKINLRVSETYKIRYKKNAKYITSKPKVASVSKKGLIKAKKNGRCVIKVMAKKKCVSKIKVTVCNDKREEIHDSSSVNQDMSKVNPVDVNQNNVNVTDNTGHNNSNQVSCPPGTYPDNSVLGINNMTLLEIEKIDDNNVYYIFDSKEWHWSMAGGLDNRCKYITLRINKDDIKIDISVGDKVSVDMVSEYMIVGENAIFETGLINISPIPEKQTNTTS